MIRKVIDGGVALIFFLFAYLQLNDPDFWWWVLIYGLVAIVAILNLFGALNKSRTFKTLIVFIILLVIYFSNLIAWIKAGFPDMVNYTDDNVVIAEGIREYFGLLISFIVILLYHLFARKSDKKDNA